MTTAILNSADPFIQCLKEEDNNLKILALERLAEIVDSQWAEIADSLSEIIALFQNVSFPRRELAAYIGSKVYFHLEKYENSLDLALESGAYFDISQRNQYVDCLVACCIDKYVKTQQFNFDNILLEQVAVNQKYQNVVEQIFKQSLDQKQYKEVLGIAVEARRSDIIEGVLQEQSKINNDLLNYLYEVSKDLVINTKFRTLLLNIIAKFYNIEKANVVDDYVNLVQCYYFLGDTDSASKLLFTLISSDQALLAYQLANDLTENENQAFINQVISKFPATEDNEQLTKVKNNLIKILNGEIKRNLDIIFLKNNNKFDKEILNKIQKGTDTKKSIAHGAVIVANALYNAGTTNDEFIKDQFEWIKKATHWAKFSATASLGVIHKGNVTKAMSLFEKYLPSNSPEPNHYANGGALFGLGLIHGGKKSQEMITYFGEIIRNQSYNQHEVIIHGASLGMGLVGLASEDESIYIHLNDVLQTNSAVIGEAAAIGIGLNMAGSANNEVIDNLFKYAHDTDHEKIIRSISLSLAMIMFGKEGDADPLICNLCDDKDAILRYGGCLTIGMAYCGTGNNKAVEKLLQISVDDVSDDVRRSAVIALAFVLFKQYQQIPKIMNLLSLSYNPHVRYGTALAVGIACAGTMYKEGLDIIEPLLNDNVDFVRQAAFIGMAMIMQNTNPKNEPRVEKFKKNIEEVYQKKHEDILAKYGALIAAGLLETGGRNSMIQLASESGVPKLGACVGMLIFSHFWYWFPLVHFITLSFGSVGLIGTTENFSIPTSFEFKSNAKPSQFEYPAPTDKHEEKKTEKVDTVQLSTTAKAQIRKAIKKEGGELNSLQNLKSQKSSSKVKNPNISPEKGKTEENKEKEAEKMIEEEAPQATFKLLNNPARVLNKQQKYIEYIDNRYTPIIKSRKRGILFLKDSQPDERDDFIDINGVVIVEEKKDEKPLIQPIETIEEEVLAPEDFTYDDDQQNLLSKQE